MKKSKKSAFVKVVIAALSIAVLSGLGSGSAAAAADEIPEGYVKTHDGRLVDVSGVTLRIGAAEGTNGQTVLEGAGLDDTPYKVEYANMQGGNLVMEALAANQIDLGAGSQIPPLNASLANNGGNFRIIAVRYGSTLWQELITGPDSTITSVEELKGKTVGYNKNTTANYFLFKMLEEVGLTWEDIDAVPLTTSDGLTAVLTGEVDALASYGNSIRSAKAKGAKTIKTAQNILSGNYLFYATPYAIEDEAYHAAIEDWLERWHESHAWAREHAQEWAAFYAPIINMDPAEYQKQYEEQNADKIYAAKPITDTVIEDEQSIADAFETLGLVAQHIEAEKLFDDSFTEAVASFQKYD